MKFGGKSASSRPPLSPDPEIIRELAGLLTETGLTEIEYSVGDHRIRVARDAGGRLGAPVANGQVATAPPAAELERPALPMSSSSEIADHPGMLTSPMVGVAYLAPEPGAAPFVRVGDTVEKDQTLLIIEAMKVMNQIRAPQAGRLARIFIADGDPVEYGAHLMLIE